MVSGLLMDGMHALIFFRHQSLLSTVSRYFVWIVTSFSGQQFNIKIAMPSNGNGNCISRPMFPLSCARVHRSQDEHTQKLGSHMNFALKNFFFIYFTHVVLNVDECW